MAGEGACGEFVDGWLVTQVLGEGAYGEVVLLRHEGSGARVALKAVGGGSAGAREAALHGALRHPHVLRCLGARAHPPHHYLFLEWARGGELFDRIAPDVGMPRAQAARFALQLLSGVRYLHSRGVAHRDLKPENLLLDHRDTLKISDFGLATMFRRGSRERLLTRVAGTLPYAAPEVLVAPHRPYRAPPADLWSAALVLLAMLTGELPWERASESDARYARWAAWCQQEGESAPPPPGGVWSRTTPGALRLLRGALHPRPDARPALAALLLDAWLTGESGCVGAGGGSLSQPAAGAGGGGGAGDEVEARVQALLSYSQPSRWSELVLGSQPAPLAHGQLGRRMTRVWLRPGEGVDAALQVLQGAVRARGGGWRAAGAGGALIECGGELRVRVCALRVSGGGGERVVLEFRRARGCGLQFKRCFEELRAALEPLAAPLPAETMDVQ